MSLPVTYIVDSANEEATTTPGAANLVPEVVRTTKKRRRIRDVGGRGSGEVDAEVVGGFDHGTLKAAGRAFCRLGTPFTHVYHIVTEGVNWDLARDAALRGQPSSSVGPGSVPSAQEIKSIKDKV